MHFAEKHLEICKEVQSTEEVVSTSLSSIFAFGFTVETMLERSFTLQKQEEESFSFEINLCVYCVPVCQTGDRGGELTARMNVSDLQMVLGLSYSTNNSTISENEAIDYNLNGQFKVLCLL